MELLIQMLDWLLKDLFPNFIQNISILATLGSSFLTLLIWRKTRKLYEFYNNKTSSFYVVDNIASAYLEYSNKIKGIKDECISEKDKHAFWDLIKKINGHVIAYEVNATNEKGIGIHITKFKSNTDFIVKRPIDSLAKKDIWDYYNYLTELHQILKSIQDIDVRKMTSQ